MTLLLGQLETGKSLVKEVGQGYYCPESIYLLPEPDGKEISSSLDIPTQKWQQERCRPLNQTLPLLRLQVFGLISLIYLFSRKPQYTVGSLCININKQAFARFSASVYVEYCGNKFSG